MLEDEFKELLHRIALAFGIAHGHPDPTAYAAGVVAAQESVTAEVKTLDPIAGDKVLTDGKEWRDE